MFKVIHYNQFFKDSYKAEGLELCRVVLQGLPMYQHFSIAWPGHASGKDKLLSITGRKIYLFGELKPRT